MGLFSKKIEVVAPMSGELIDITQVEDITFSQKMLGDGVAIVPVNGKLVSPVDGKIIQVFHTKHAIGVDLSGVEILIHVGMNTVELQGEGFTAHVKEGDKVSKGDLMLEVDLALLREKGYPTETPIVITNMEIVKNLDKKLGTVVAGQDVIMELKK
ncbi:MAG: PTS glucose transporter subunit IIA [Tissierellia bacterium]|nr:PTS glucose transporter subunit IIA [Tissierellia bacterium]